MLYDLNGNQGMTWAFNPFYMEHDRRDYDQLLPVEVQSAFGSCAMIKTSILKSPDVLWGTDGHGEHIGFCKSLRKRGIVLVCPNINPIMHIEQKNFSHEQLVVAFQKKNLILKGV